MFWGHGFGHHRGRVDLAETSSVMSGLGEIVPLSNKGGTTTPKQQAQLITQRSDRLH